MFSFKFITAVIAALMLSSVEARADSPHTLKNAESDLIMSPQLSHIGEIKVLAEGFHSPIERPFAGLFRDAETYLALTKLDNNLPQLNEEFFKSNVVIAAYLGTR